MLAQISFTADKTLKKQAMTLAKAKGITLKAVLLLSLKAFVDGKIDLGITSNTEQDVEELRFASTSLQKKAEKLATLLE